MAEFLESQSRKIVHTAFPPKASELSRKCWGSFPIPSIARNFRRTDRERVT